MYNLNFRLLPIVTWNFIYKWGFMPFGCIIKRLPLRLLLSDVNIFEIPKSTKFNHPIGIVIGNGVKIGENCLIRQNVTIGSNGRGIPTIGNNVDIGSSVIILGKISIGDGCKIGAGSIILEDIPANTTVVNEIKIKMWQNKE